MIDKQKVDAALETMYNLKRAVDAAIGCMEHGLIVQASREEIDRHNSLYGSDTFAVGNFIIRPRNSTQTEQQS